MMKKRFDRSWHQVHDGIYLFWINDRGWQVYRRTRDRGASSSLDTLNPEVNHYNTDYFYHQLPTGSP